ncbi:MAG TPA: RNA 3'-terminal phosphate cyclase [Desulfuromonadales bacterium]|nr:RNA 3'-terminal phosphate cyclase [Desulfuromonadales bacterium]
MILIDGAAGEGGGQVLRSALTLSLLTGTPFKIVHIRARRHKPGLMAQHLQAVAAAAAVGSARVEGAHPGSTTLVFVPTTIRPGHYRFEIGTAGSTSLVLQTVLLPLVFARGPSTIEITGGTHVAWSPCFHYLDLHWLPYLREMGLAVELALVRAGFYPRGGGQVTARIRPAEILRGLSLVERGRLRRIFCLSAVGNLEQSVAERQSCAALPRLAGLTAQVESRNISLPSVGKGTVCLILAEFERTRCCYYALGERGKPAERVAEEAVDAFLAFLDTDGAIDEFLADQLLLPLALAQGASELRTARVSQHLLTNAEVIRRFLSARIEIIGSPGKAGLVRVQGNPAAVAAGS